MDRNRLSEMLLMDESIVSMQDLVIMERLSVKYPYCSVFKVLGLKFAYTLKNFNTSVWLAMAGIYISDRSYLETMLANVTAKPRQVQKVELEKTKEDIITKINSYQDEQLSDNPTKQELLERFLKIENPKTSSVKEKQISENEEVDRAIKDSAKKDFKFVTENMAKIYAQQGDKSTAIKIYQQLIERHPNKTAYYTNQIEILKNN